MEQSEKNTIISLRDIFVRFDGEVILNHINLDFKDKEFITILGPSGCGKTTTLRIIGGFVEPESGDVLFDGKRINGTPPNKRNVNTVTLRIYILNLLFIRVNIMRLSLSRTHENGLC